MGRRVIPPVCSTDSGCRVLLTGGAGYVGSALLPKLLQSGYRVRVMDRLIYGLAPIQHLLDHPNLDVLKIDVRHVDELVAAMHDVHAVIHLAAIVGDPACALDHEVTVDVNLNGTHKVAEIAKGSGVRRFIFASTCSVYGACDQILDETSRTLPVSLYGHTKLAAETGLREMMSETFQPTILRFSTIYGLSGRIRFDLVVNLLTAMAAVDGLITIQGGNQWRPFLHVDDAALALLMALQAGPAVVSDPTFNVGSDAQNFTIDEIGHLVQGIVREARLVIEDKATDKRNYRVSCSKIANKLGFVPRWGVEQGIKQVLEAVRSGAVANYREPIYRNRESLIDSGLIEVLRERRDWSVYLRGAEKEMGSAAETHFSARP